MNPEDREAMLPGITGRSGGRLFTRRLFPGIGPDTTAAETLQIIERLTTASPDKALRTLGALYILAALTTFFHFSTGVSDGRHRSRFVVKRMRRWREPPASADSIPTTTC